MPKKDPRLAKCSDMIKEELGDDGFTPDFSLFYSILSPRLEMVSDKREQWKIKHNLSEIIAIVFFAVLCNEDEWVAIEDFARDMEDELRTYLKLPGGIPSHDTIERVFSLIDEKELEGILVDVLMDIIVRATKDDNLHLYSNEELGITIDDVIAVDGKETRGTGKTYSEDKAESRNMNNLNVQSTEYGITLSSTRISEKSNEIPEAQRVIRKMNLKGTVVTADAMNTQKDTAAVIIDSKGDYCLALKSNHKLAYGEIGEYFEDKKILKEIREQDGRYRKETEEASRKKTIREYYITDDLGWFQDKGKWKKLTSMGYERKTIKNLHTGAESIEERYFLCSFPADAELFALCVRRHWHVENLLHWVLDVTFRQDYLHTKNKTALNNLGHVQRFVLSILKVLKSYYGKSFRRIREHIGRKFSQELPVVFSALKILYDKGRNN